MTPVPCDTVPCPAVEDIDRQHCRLAELLNRFEDAFSQQVPLFVLQAAVSDLIAYSEIHLRDQVRRTSGLVSSAFEQHLCGDHQLLLHLGDFQQALVLGRDHLSSEALHAYLTFFLHRVRSSCHRLALPGSARDLHLVPSGVTAPPHLHAPAG